MLAVIFLILVVVVVASFSLNKKSSNTTVPVTNPSPKPSIPLFKADFSSPSIGLKLAVTESVPPEFTTTEDAVYCTFDREGGYGRDVVDPGPNKYYDTNGGVLNLRSDGVGYPIVTVKSFDKTKPFSMAATLSATLDNPYGWGGLVCYNGEEDYIAEYYSAGPDGKLSVDVWFPHKIVPLNIFVETGSIHTFKIECNSGVTKVYFDNNHVHTENWDIKNDPHLALFLGDMTMTCYDMSVYD